MEDAHSTWQWLPNGVECKWQSRNTLFRWHLIIFIELLIVTPIVIFTWVIHAYEPSANATFGLFVLFAAYFIPGFGRSVLRGRFMHSRLRATANEGVHLWAKEDQRPYVAVARDQIADVRIESDPWTWKRQWQLIVAVKGRCRSRRVLFTSRTRTDLDGIRRAIRHALQLRDS